MNPVDRDPAEEDRREGGSVTLELVLLTPVFIGVLLAVVAFGRLTSARLDVDGAANQAARAASIATDPADATVAATQTATAALRSACAHLTVDTDTAAFAPGGQVTVTVACTVSLADLAGLHLPAAKTIRSHSQAVIDTYRPAS